MIIIQLLALLALFLPGFLCSLLLFRNIDGAERVAITFGLTITLVLFFGFLLTGISYYTNTKMITTLTVWIIISGCSVFFGLILILQRLFSREGKHVNKI